MWDQNGITVVGGSNSTSGSFTQLRRPFGISISDNDVLYIAEKGNHRIVVVHLSSTVNILTIGSGPGNASNQLDNPTDVFVKNTKLYVVDADNSRVQDTSLNGSYLTPLDSLNGLYRPFYIFVDKNDSIYLSNTQNHTVLLCRPPLLGCTIVAGTGTLGSAYHQLKSPYGVFVDGDGTLFIADRHNYRIMKWYAGATTGIIVAGNGTPGASFNQLDSPTQVIVDEMNEYMYISEAENSRITRWGPNSTFGVCIAACSGVRGSASTQLDRPHSLAFDSFGSLYVSDLFNDRIQKFQILRYNST